MVLGLGLGLVLGLDLNLVLPKVESIRPTGPASPSCTFMLRKRFMSVPGLKRFLQMTVDSSCTRSTWLGSGSG